MKNLGPNLYVKNLGPNLYMKHMGPNLYLKNMGPNFYVKNFGPKSYATSKRVQKVKVMKKEEWERELVEKKERKKDGKMNMRKDSRIIIGLN